MSMMAKPTFEGGVLRLVGLAILLLVSTLFAGILSSRAAEPAATTIVATADPWDIVNVNPAAGGETTSLALDHHGRPAISFYRTPTSSGVRLAQWDETTWQILMPYGYYFAGEYSSVEIDAQDHVHLAFYSGNSYGDNKDLLYSVQDATTWETEAVDTDGDVGKYCSLALDSAGHPHISYHRAIDSSHGALKYAWWDGATWYTSTVETGGERTGTYSSVAVDAADLPHIAYCWGDWRGCDLKYARWDGATWHSETVDGAGDAGEFASLALDSAGHPQISYYDRLNRNLKHARWDGNQWLIETVDHATGAGQYTSLALDSAGLPHIGYVRLEGTTPDEQTGDVRYASWDGGAWRIDVVETGRAARGVSLALDATGEPRMSYVHSDGQDAVLFAQPAPTPFDPPLPGPQTDGEMPGIARAPGGGVIIVWTDDRLGAANHDIYAQRFDPAGAAQWWTDRAVSRAYNAYSNDPAIVMDAQARAFALWSGNGNIYAQELDADGRRVWSADRLLYGYPHNGVEPHAGLDQAGNWYAQWRTWWSSCTGAPCPGLQAMKLGPSGWDDTVIVSREAEEADFAVASDGSLRLAWREGWESPNYDVYALSLTPEGAWSWSDRVQLNDSAAHGRLPALAVNSVGESYVVWHAVSAPAHLYAQKLSTTGQRLWEDDVPIEGTDGDADWRRHDVAVDAGEFAYIVWAASFPSGPDRILMQKLSPDGAHQWAQDVRVDAGQGPNDLSLPAIAIDSNGYVYVVWRGVQNNKGNIYLQSLTSAGTRRWANDVVVEGPGRVILPTPTRTATPRYTPTHTATATTSPTASASPTTTRTPTRTPTSTITRTPSRTPTKTITTTPTRTPSPTRTGTASRTPTRTLTPSITPTIHFTRFVYPPLIVKQHVPASTPTPTEEPQPTASATATETPTATPQATPGDEPDLSTSVKLVDKASARPGERLTYTVILHNTGSSANTAFLTDPVPEQITYVQGSVTGGASYIPGGDLVVWTGAMPAGAYQVITFQANVNVDTVVGTSIQNDAAIGDGVAGNIPIVRSAVTVVTAAE